MTARVHPEWTIRKADGSVWRDKKGIAWVNPYHHELWDYNIGVAEELVKMGFGEVQFDYIRFPEPYTSLAAAGLPGRERCVEARCARRVSQRGEDAAQQARRALDGRHLRARHDGERTARGRPALGADLAAARRRAADGVSVALPARRAGHRASERRAVQDRLQGDLDARTSATRSSASQNPNTCGPWLQAFTLGKPAVRRGELEAQKKAVYDAGYDGWVLWNPGSIYDVYMPALEKTFVSRKKS